MASSIVVASGKGGVGKTSLAVNLGLTLARQGRRTVLLDADFGMANAHILIGANPKRFIMDAIQGDATMADVLCDAPHGMKFISGGSGLLDMLNLDQTTRYQMIRMVDEISDQSEVLIADVPAGASDSSIAFVAAADRVVVVLVGEPTSPNHMGEMMKIGRRGSLTAFFTAHGVQGHSAYPHRAKNPLPALARLMDRLASHALDQGTEHFDQSTLAITTIDVGNPATNVIPAMGKATVNIRFNDAHSGESLTEWLASEVAKVTAETGVDIDMKVKISGESFITPPGELSTLIASAVKDELGVTPELSTTGGTSDARFVKDMCPVTEFGLVGKTMHQVDERVEVAQIGQLKAIYTRILRAYFP